MQVYKHTDKQMVDRKRDE